MSTQPNNVSTESSQLGSGDRHAEPTLGEIHLALAKAHFRSIVRAVGFWAAIVLPFIHIPLLVTGLSSGAELVAFVTLVVANVVAIHLGGRHRPRRRSV